ncbi:helix-turn-helix domain-containing protein [Dysgonomonas sp. Marseille-P4677]|uniref:helix-turn-helix domain-containing protein n=1 Tax=Dysgonomonas sp. Marseille-P4677 TaxID=2364790 RepID=UPI0019117290|nr:helix-turn-helix domain-containing protein [Dysgonomonas sp. Marseille-P4677]MBK5721310.1 helix-turn-helix domain-containing protein [Dysgonomonas sp. Marseille-P4677]
MTGKEIKKKRKELKLTQEELAKILGVDRKTIGNYENDHVSIPETKSEMLRNFFSGNVSGSNIMVGTNTGNIAGGNFILVELPEFGKQKIIKPDGTIIIESISSSKNSEEGDFLMDKEKQTLLEKIELQQQLIKSLQDQLAMYRDKK